MSTLGTTDQEEMKATIGGMLKSLMKQRKRDRARQVRGTMKLSPKALSAHL